MATKRAPFIVLEGTDRSGKSTQTKRLTGRFLSENIPVVSIKFPDRDTTIGSILDKFLQKKEEINLEVAHLLFSANRWEAKEKILKYLSEGKMVICDRYAFSGVAYTASQGKDIEWCKSPDSGLPKPDLVFYFDLEEELIAKRQGFGDEIYETVRTQKLVNQIYNDCLFDSEYWIKIPISAELDEKKVEDILYKYIKEKMSEILPEVQELWVKK